MKSLELSEKNKEQLLEIANTLFPEGAFTFDNDSGEDGIIDRNFCALKNEDSKRLYWNDEGSHFHWYEFSLNQVVDEIAWKYTSSDIRADVEFEHFRMNLITDIFKSKSVNEEFHIVDYLYNKHFKKLY